MKKLVVVLAAMLTFTSTAFAQIGSLAADLVFTPVTPCRIVDTRTSQGGTGPIATGAVKAFTVWGVSSYAAQGGSPTNCGIVAGGNTAAIAVSMAVVFPAGQGFLTAFPGNVADVAKPLAATLNYNAGEVVVSNAAILKVSQGALPDLKVFASNSTEVIIDVVGYYAKPVSVGSLVCANVAATSASVAGFQTITSTCTTGIVTGGSCDTSNSAAKPNTGSFFSGNGWMCETNNYPGNTTAATITSTARCCQIPGR